MGHTVGGDWIGYRLRAVASEWFGQRPRAGRAVASEWLIEMPRVGRAVASEWLRTRPRVGRAVRVVFMGGLPGFPVAGVASAGHGMRFDRRRRQGSCYPFMVGRRVGISAP